MKKVFLTLIITSASVASFSQATKALTIDNSKHVQIGNFNPLNASTEQFQTVMQVSNDFTPRDFIYDAKNGNAIFQDKSNGLVFCQLKGDQIITKTFSMQNTVMAPSYMPAEQKIACFNVSKEFNGYGNNEDNLFFSTIDVNTGLTKNLIQFKDLSFDNVAAPFFGKTSVNSRFSPIPVEKEVAISKPLFIAEKGLYVVMVRDVTGTNRLYKIKVNTPKAAVSSNRCNANIVDMAYVSGTDIVKTLYFETSGNGYNLMVGDMNIITNTFSNPSVVKSFTAKGKVILDNASIKFNKDQSQLFVSQFDGSKTSIYNIDVVTNGTANVKNYAGNIQFDFGFSESSYQKPTYANVYKLYPNPSTGIFYFRNQTGVIPNSLEVYDNVGQIVKVIKVEDAVTEIKIDLEGMAPGVYYVKADLAGEDFYGKVIVTK